MKSVDLISRSEAVRAKNSMVNHEVREARARDGVSLNYRLWSPASPRASVVCLHGIRSHGAWYGDSCRYLSGKGYRILFPDRRGSGLNSGCPSEVESYRVWVADVEDFIALAERDLPGKPVHLMGISWGGRLASVVAAGGRARLRSLVLSTPGIVSVRDYSFRKKVSVALAILFRSKREFAIPLEDPSLFTDSPDDQLYIDEDASGLRKVSARFLLESKRLEDAARKLFVSITVPLFMTLAGRDLIVNNEEVKKLFARCGRPDNLMKVYDMARHTLEFDPCRDEYFADLDKWLGRNS